MAAAAATLRALLRYSLSRSARFDRGVAEEGWEGADVGAILEEVGVERMPEGVAGHAL